MSTAPFVVRPPEAVQEEPSGSSVADALPSGPDALPLHDARAALRVMDSSWSTLRSLQSRWLALESDVKERQTQMGNAEPPLTRNRIQLAQWDVRDQNRKSVGELRSQQSELIGAAAEELATGEAAARSLRHIRISGRTAGLQGIAVAVANPGTAAVQSRSFIEEVTGLLAARRAGRNVDLPVRTAAHVMADVRKLVAIRRAFDVAVRRFQDALFSRELLRLSNCLRQAEAHVRMAGGDGCSSDLAVLQRAHMHENNVREALSAAVEAPRQAYGKVLDLALREEFALQNANESAFFLGKHLYETARLANQPLPRYARMPSEVVASPDLAMLQLQLLGWDAVYRSATRHSVGRGEPEVVAIAAAARATFESFTRRTQTAEPSAEPVRFDNTGAPVRRINPLTELPEPWRAILPPDCLQSFGMGLGGL